jgi:multidrug efflux pump subunit AcrA (membrane-fusion protein)
LHYTTIISPIDGVVISRNVDVGQTVAAALAAPMLFLIAQDFTRMQVDTNVAEADIGKIHAGRSRSPSTPFDFAVVHAHDLHHGGDECASRFLTRG